MSVLPAPPQLIRPSGASDDEATLIVDGRVFRGWEEVEVTRSIEEAAATFGFRATHRWPDEPNTIRIRPHGEAVVYLGDDLVVSGFVDTSGDSYGATDHTLPVTGRSRTGQLVDCSAIEAGPTFRRQTLGQIAGALVAPYGLTVEVLADTGAPIERFVLEPTESPFEAIERLARLRQLLVTDDAEGNLVLTRAGTARAVGALICEGGPTAAALKVNPWAGPRGNILQAAAVFDGTGRFSEYICRGQTVASDNDYGVSSVEAEGTETDDGVELRRVLRISPEGPADRASCKARATWEAARRAGLSVRYEATVQGWRQTAGGPLWEPNLVVPVNDAIVGLDTELVIVSCAYRRGNGGTTCSMVLLPQGAFLAEPPRRASKGSAARGRWKEIDNTKVPSP